MGGSNYIPRNAVAFNIWLKATLTYIIANCTRWGIEAPEESVVEQAKNLQVLTEKCTAEDHSPMDTLRRNDARKAIEKIIRTYLRGMVLYNAKVTDEDRRMMGIPVYDKVRTPIGDPAGQAEAKITYPARTQLMLLLRHLEGTPFDQRANYGFRIYFGVYPTGQPLPPRNDLRESKFTRQKKCLFTFDPSDSGNTAVFCIRYENSKGEPGQWGPMFSAVIP